MEQSTLPFDSVEPPHDRGAESALHVNLSGKRVSHRNAAGTLTATEPGTSEPMSSNGRDSGGSGVAGIGVVAIGAGIAGVSVVGGSARVEFVRHSRARRYLIRVRLDGSVRVTIPRRGSKREAAAFYLEQQEWVTSQQRRVQQLRRTIPEDLPADVQKRLRREARTVLPARLRELAEEVGISVAAISIRNQRHRWGSCSASGAISLNWRLITMPAWVRDYVMYHELMHTRRMDHSPAFWALVKEVCPNYEEARRWLRRHAHAPHAASC